MEDMRQNIYDAVTSLLEDAADCDSKKEIVDELTDNLCAKYDDLTAQGMSGEDAFDKVLSDMGDVDEIVAFINASEGKRKGCVDFDFDAAFAGFDSVLKDIKNAVLQAKGPVMDAFHQVKEPVKDAFNQAKEPVKDAFNQAKEPVKDAFHQAANPVKDVFNQVKEPVMGAFNQAKGPVMGAFNQAKGPVMDAFNQAKGPVQNVARDIGNSVREVAHDLGTATRCGGSYRYDRTIPGAEINGLDVHTKGGDVTIGFSEDDNIYVVEWAKGPLDETQQAEIYSRPDGVLCVSQGRTAASSLFFGRGLLSSDLEIFLPRRRFNSIRINTTSGDVDFGPGIDVGEMDVHTVSGDLHCHAADCGVLRAVSTSGDVEVSGVTDTLIAESTSGDVDVNGCPSQVSGKTVSGDLSIQMAVMPQSMEVSSVSGSIRLTLPENDGFSVRYQKVSGSLKSDFNLMTSINSREGEAVYRDGTLRAPYFIKTISGNLKISRK